MRGLNDLRARKRAALNATPGNAAWSDPEAWTAEDEKRLEELEEGAADAQLDEDEE